MDPTSPTSSYAQLLPLSSSQSCNDVLLTPTYAKMGVSLLGDVSLSNPHDNSLLGLSPEKGGYLPIMLSRPPLQTCDSSFDMSNLGPASTTSVTTMIPVDQLTLTASQSGASVMCPPGYEQLDPHHSGSNLGLGAFLDNSSSSHNHTSVVNQIYPTNLLISTSRGFSTPPNFADISPKAKDSLDNKNAGVKKPRNHKGGWPKGKPRKDPTISVPKAPVSGYVLFQKERRQNLMAENPDLTFYEVTKLIGREWSSMGTKDKQPYIEKANGDRERYLEEMEEFYNNPTIFARRDPHQPPPLYCEICDVTFMNVHNLKNHMISKAHLEKVQKQVVAEQAEFYRGQAEQQALAKADVMLLNWKPDEDPATWSGCFDSVNVEEFVAEFVRKDQSRSFEIQVLKEQLEKAHLQIQDAQLLQKYWEEKRDRLEHDKAQQRRLCEELEKKLLNLHTYFQSMN